MKIEKVIVIAEFIALNKDNFVPFLSQFHKKDPIAESVLNELDKALKEDDEIEIPEERLKVLE